MHLSGEDVRGRTGYYDISLGETHNISQAGWSAFLTCHLHRLFPQSSWFVSAALVKIGWKIC